MTTFTWTIKQFDFDPGDGYVSKVYYGIEAKEGEWRFSRGGSVILPRPKTLIPYDQITEALALEWVKDFLGEDQVEAEEARTKESLDSIKPVSTESGLPWEQPAPDEA